MAPPSPGPPRLVSYADVRLVCVRLSAGDRSFRYVDFATEWRRRRRERIYGIVADALRPATAAAADAVHRITFKGGAHLF